MKNKLECRNVLFWFAMILGLIMISMMLIQFFFPETRFPEDLEIFYVVILIAYVIVKEFSRWTGEASSIKLGEHLVFIWVGAFILMQISEFILGLLGLDHTRFVVPKEMLRTTIEVISIYACSEVSKKIYKKKLKK